MRHFDDTPDDSRPRNPWPRLLALGAVILASVVAAGACLVAFVNTGAEPELRIALNAVEPGVPRFEPITSWGADDEGFTYGIWVVQIPETGTRAYFSRHVTSGCHVRWDATRQIDGVTGVFRDPCSETIYGIDGMVIDGPGTRHLDRFDVDLAGGEIRVDFSVLQVGECRGEPQADDPICNPPGGSTTRSIPRNTALPDDFASR